MTQRHEAGSSELSHAVDTKVPESKQVISRLAALLGKPGSSIGRLLGPLGPGLVTGAADDDSSGIATYSQIGAQFGYTLLWTMLFIFPFMTGIQEISARLGRVTGRGIAGNIKCLYSPWILYVIVLLLLFANIINIGADIGAMGAAANLLVGGPTLLYCALFTTVSDGAYYGVHDADGQQSRNHGQAHPAHLPEDARLGGNAHHGSGSNRNVSNLKLALVSAGYRAVRWKKAFSLGFVY